MYKILLLVFLLIPFVSSQELNIEELDPNMTLEKADSKGIAWFDPKCEPFRLVGFKYIKKDGVFRRLPVKPDWEIRKAVNSLANSTAGGQVHFQTNSAKIFIRAEIAYASGMYHMPPTGQSGFDIYMGEPGNQNYVATSRFGARETKYEVELFKGSKEMRSFTLNFPLYNGVKKLEIGVVAGATVKKAKAFKEDGTIVVYGTSITQGGCASRPGMAYSNILSRKMNMEFTNLGFSGNGKGEPALANLINQIENKKMVVLDYEANVYEDIKNSLEPFIDILREKNPTMPILVISKIRYAREINSENQMKSLVARAEFQKGVVDKRKAAGDQNIYFLDGGTLLGEDAHECTVDGVHPTDLGFLKMARSIEPVLRKILKLEK